MLNHLSELHQRGLGQARMALGKLPQHALKPGLYLPFPVQKKALSKILYLVFKESLEEGDLDFLKGHWLKLEVSDLGVSWLFSCDPKGQVLVSRSGASDVCIRGSLKSFVTLAAQREDPDTLFFQRDLVIEGDTDLGLHVKNLLDTLEIDELPPELVFALRAGADFMELFPTR